MVSNIFFSPLPLLSSNRKYPSHLIIPNNSRILTKFLLTRLITRFHQIYLPVHDQNLHLLQRWTFRFVHEDRKCKSRLHSRIMINETRDTFTVCESSTDRNWGLRHENYKFISIMSKIRLLPPPWNITPVPRAQLRIYHSRLLTDPARNSSWPSRLHSTSTQGVFTVARFMSVLPPRSREGEGDAGKSFPDKCAVLVLTASGEDREGISFSCQAARAAISPPLVRLSPFSNEPSV